MTLTLEMDGSVLTCPVPDGKKFLFNNSTIENSSRRIYKKPISVGKLYLDIVLKKITKRNLLCSSVWDILSKKRLRNAAMNRHSSQHLSLSLFLWVTFGDPIALKMVDPCLDLRFRLKFCRPPKGPSRIASTFFTWSFLGTLHIIQLRKYKFGFLFFFQFLFQPSRSFL